MGKLDRIGQLVNEFDEAQQIKILAQWGIKDEYRVNNVFHMMGQTNESLPSPPDGIRSLRQMAKARLARKVLGRNKTLSNEIRRDANNPQRNEFGRCSS